MSSKTWPRGPILASILALTLPALAGCSDYGGTGTGPGGGPSCSSACHSRSARLTSASAATASPDTRPSLSTPTRRSARAELAGLVWACWRS